MQKHSNLHEDGFTITEMVVVMAIITILTVIALQTFGAVKNKGRLSRVETNINVIDDALYKFAQKNNGLFPGLTEWPIPPSTLGLAPNAKVMGNRIIGGNAGPKDANPLDPTGSTAIAQYTVNQDDYLDDTKQLPSPFRRVMSAKYSLFSARMRPIDALFEESLLVPYPDNPLKPPGIGMVNTAYALGSYYKATNNFSLVPITGFTSPPYLGLAPGYPKPVYTAGGPTIDAHVYKYSIYAYMWDYYTDNPVNQWNYPEGDFAYIPLGLSDATGRYATDYWLIGYGDQNTLKNSPYNQLLSNPNFPNLPPPLGDGFSNTPPAPGSYEFMVRQFVRGALIIKATKYEDQLSIDRR
jgi:prepilin-type N-terminal cleavage/methylation domain-containing protein